MSSSRVWLTVGAVLSGLAVAAGAFGAHGLDRYFRVKYAGEWYEKSITADGREVELIRKPLAEKYLADVKTGAEYQMYHGLALLVVGVLARSGSRRGWQVAGWCFLLGCAGFSGGLYAYTFTGLKWIGMTIVPCGGSLFIAGWTALALTVWRSPASSGPGAS